MEKELLDRILLIPGRWKVCQNIISHKTLKDDLGNDASILVSLIYHETKRLHCNCCASGMVPETYLPRVRHAQIFALSWIGPPSPKEWARNPQRARKNFAKAALLPSEDQKRLLGEDWKGVKR